MALAARMARPRRLRWRVPARAEYPDKQITMVVCFPAGGGTDIAARLVNTQLGEALGKPVIIENRGGAGGNIAIAAVKRLPADGYTLLVCSSAYVVNPSLYAQAAYDPLKDFVPLMVIGASPNVFVVPEKSEIKTMKEFIDKAKANPGKINWTSPGAGTTPQLAGELIKLRTGIEMQHIPFPGAGPATNAVLGRPGRSLHRQPRLGAGPDRRRQGAADRGDVEEALAAAAERADAGGARRQGRGVRHIPGRLRAGRHAAADHRPAGEGTDARSSRGRTSRRSSTRSACRWWPKGRPRSARASSARCRCTRRSSTRRG